MDVPDPAVHRAGQPVPAVAAGQQQRHRHRQQHHDRADGDPDLHLPDARARTCTPACPTAAGCGSGPPTSPPTATRRRSTGHAGLHTPGGLGTWNFEAAGEHRRGHRRDVEHDHGRRAVHGQEPVHGRRLGRRADHPRVRLGDRPPLPGAASARLGEPHRRARTRTPTTATARSTSGSGRPTPPGSGSSWPTGRSGSCATTWT